MAAIARIGRDPEVSDGLWGLARGNIYAQFAVHPNIVFGLSEPLAISDIPGTALTSLRQAGSYVSEFTTPTLRLGVTGLSRSGKTVFITGLVRNLTRPSRLPFFSPAAEGRILRAYLEPQPDDEVPRFSYEEHLAALAQDPPVWPESTRRIAQLRVTVEYIPVHPLRRRFGVSRLHVDIVDYPGEWLIDLPMLEQSYAVWSRGALESAHEPRRAKAAAGFLGFLAGVTSDQPHDEATALAGTAQFTAYLTAARSSPVNDPTLGPGRFLMPGDLDGSPLLTFFPLNVTETTVSPRGSLGQMLERRFEAYKSHVVRPFFRDHFAKLDRQIVLVDALSAVDAGAPALADLERSLGDVLACFRPGVSSWLGRLLGRRIDRILFAATKADHLHPMNHDRLEAILSGLTRRASERAQFAGASVKSVAIAALRATREAEMTRQGETLGCIVGTPLPGERIGAETFDGRRLAAIFPGDLPVSLEAALARGVAEASDASVRFVRFRPTRIGGDGPTGTPVPWPHIRLDRALDFLMGDRLT